MISQTTHFATSIRASVLGAVLEAHQTYRFKTLPDLKRWFIASLARDFMKALEAHDRPFAHSAIGALTSSMALVDSALRRRFTVEQFIEIVGTTLPLTIQEIP